ncbi:hypothetical protein [Salibacterium aidingense]|uniref:hypothetical protein n=1 Tax=Salibacterium aidingense TaxID=384933 RepID=UPI000424EB4A|nr:hypothetical protein [Salibacterium aidingense]
MLPSLLPVQNERISARLLNDDRCCLDYLKKLQKKIQAPSLLVAASQFSKRYARFVTEAAFSPIYLEQRYPLMTLDDAELVTDWSAEKWSPSFALQEQSGSAVSRETVMHDVFAGHLAPLWRTMNTVTRVPMPMLWENTAVRVFSLYEKKLPSSAAAPLEKQIEGDFRYMVQEASGELFGEAANPLRPFFNSSTEERNSKNIRVRKTCCFLYETGGGRSCCSTCPKYHNF